MAYTGALAIFLATGALAVQECTEGVCADEELEVSLLQAGYQIKPSASAGNNNGGGDNNATSSKDGGAGNPPCQCEVTNPNWMPCARTVPRCVFIDLGAADGNTFNSFLSGAYGPVDKCPSGEWHAVLVEANPRFDMQLQQVGTTHSGLVTVMSSTAVYMCEATTSFYLDTVNKKKNYWGSSMSPNHPDVKKSGQQKVTVPTSNLNRILFENTIPGDRVLVKMDIEGTEYDLLPCLADSPSAALIDRLYLEDHNFLPKESRGSLGTTVPQFQSAKKKLKATGVDLPHYFSKTLFAVTSQENH